MTTLRIVTPDAAATSEAVRGDVAQENEFIASERSGLPLVISALLVGVICGLDLALSWQFAAAVLLICAGAIALLVVVGPDREPGDLTAQPPRATGTDYPTRIAQESGGVYPVDTDCLYCYIAI